MNRFLYISFCLISVVLVGFNFQTSYPEELLSESKDYLLNLKDFSAKFSYKLESVQSKKIIYNGVLSYKHGHYKLIMENNNIYFDGNKHTIYLPPSNQYKRMEQSPSESVGLVKYMTYVYTWPSKKEYQGEEVVNGISRHKIELTITSNKAPYRKAILWMDKDNKLIVKISFVDSKKTITTYEFTEININIGLKDSDFIFDPNAYPGATEIDED